ncbi:hypothetical protein M3Y97_00956000 [Aphelenchoides bicaudatus]|nr:hypothetical protein M3Y97_00956000 [Aphelenchoides bicaudatus]
MNSDTSAQRTAQHTAQRTAQHTAQHIRRAHTQPRGRNRRMSALGSLLDMLEEGGGQRHVRERSRNQFGRGADRRQCTWCGKPGHSAEVCRRRKAESKAAEEKKTVEAELKPKKRPRAEEEEKAEGEPAAKKEKSPPEDEEQPQEIIEQVHAPESNDGGGFQRLLKWGALAAFTAAGFFFSS